MQARITSKNAQLVIRSAETLPARIEGAMATGLRRGLLGVVAIAQLEYLSGPRPGKIQSISGRLRQSVTSEVEQSPGRIVGRVGSAVKYAAFHEFGFHGVVNVRAHTRALQAFTESGGEQSLDLGPVVSDTGELLGFKRTRKQAATRLQKGFVSVGFVRAHRRKVDYAGKPYLRPAIDKVDLAGEINRAVADLK